MKWSSISAIAGKALPVLGTLLAGPAGGTVGTMIAGALGVEANPKAVADALQSPERLTDLQQWAYQHQEKLEEIAMDRLRAELSDKADAREAHQHSPMPAIVTAALTVIVACLLYLLFKIEIPADNKDVAYTLFGQASALWAASITYWVGTTRSSADKTRMMGSRQ